MNLSRCTNGLHLLFERLSVTANQNVGRSANENVRRWSHGKAPVRVMGLGGAVSKKGKNRSIRMRSKVKSLSRAETLNPDATDWSSVYAAAESYNPSVIPVPIRMGRASHNKLGQVPPNAHGNIELLKIPNFFHLTPPAIEKHCQALAPYCTPWPSEKVDRPIRITTINHVYAGPSIRHPNSRNVKLQVYLKDLDLDGLDHASKKMKLLVGDRYNPNTDELTIIADRCPTRQQNTDYAYYLLTALYHESWKEEEWEAEAHGKSDGQIQSEMAEVRQELNPKEENHRRFYKIINGKVVRYNRVGHPFLVEMGKHGLRGALTPREVVMAKQKWKEIQKDLPDQDSFDPIVHKDSESEFKYLL